MKDSDFWEQTKRMLIVPGTVVFVAMATFAWTRLFHSTILADDASMARMADEIPNESLLGLLGLLTTVATLLAYVFHQVIRRDLRREIYRMAQDERIASNAEADNASATVFWNQYFHGGQERKDVFLSLAVNVAKRSVQTLENLNDVQASRYRDLICRCKNNLAVLLAAQKDPVKEEDQLLAYNLSREIYQMALSVGRNDFPNHYAWEATHALVLARFYRGLQVNVGNRKKAALILGALIREGELPPHKRKDLDEQWEFMLGQSPENVLTELERN